MHDTVNHPAPADSDASALHARIAELEEMLEAVASQRLVINRHPDGFWATEKGPADIGRYAVTYVVLTIEQAIKEGLAALRRRELTDSTDMGIPE